MVLWCKRHLGLPKVDQEPKVGHKNIGYTTNFFRRVSTQAFDMGGEGVGLHSERGQGQPIDDDKCMQRYDLQKH